MERLRLLLRLRDAYRAGQPLPAEALDLVAESVNLLETGAEPGEALGLIRGPGEEHPARTVARERARAWLAVALKATPGGSAWARAKGLAVALGRFEAGTWPRWRALEEPPARATEQQAALFRAMKAATRAGVALPASARALLRLAER
ncbi:MAG: hypothetical protein JJU06_13085 [Ectothiorhodospiraceae bacterium]|nr:hypothetical protein [Ectothiorhodospiraceae bacterium]